MEKAEFEQKFLALVNQTDVVISAPNVAYHLGIAIEEAQEHLIALELIGVIQQISGTEDHSTYTMPSRPAPGTLPARIDTSLEASQQSGLVPGVRNPADIAPAPILGGPASAPARGRNVNGLALNVIIPGLGSLICGRKAGINMMLLLLAGIVCIFVLPGWSKLLAIVPVLAAWIWSIIAGVALLDERESPSQLPR